MDFTLSKQQQMVQKMYREFAENEVKPLAKKVDAEEYFPKETVEKMKTDLKRFAKDMPDIRIIGSGGNINKLFKLTHAKRENRYVTVDEIKDLYSKLKVLSVEERIEQYGLKVDRADVIIPAAEIFITAAEALGCDSVQVPNISLADSIVDGFYRDKYSACDIKPEQSDADEVGDDED